MPETSEKGLTAAEVAALTESGQVNAVKSSTSRSFADIVRANVFTLFNGIIFAAMVMVLVTGSWRDAVFGLVILINTGIGIITELKAKRTLDKLSILVASDYLVRRDGKDVEVPHNEIVLGDLMWIRSGEQVPADAQIVRTWGLELDESMLTGESRTVRKNEGDDIYSGSTAVSGMALVKVNAVGAHSYAATLTAQAKVYKKTVSDLNKGINTILKFMTFLVVPLCVLLIWSQVHAVGGWDVAISTGQWRSAVVSAVAGVVGMIPEGLVLLTSLNFALAAIRLARKNTLVQELESVETLARVDCLNLDKTGTVTKGAPAVTDVIPATRPDGAPAMSEKALLKLAAALERSSEHPLAEAIMAECETRGIVARMVEDFVAVPGRGVTAREGQNIIAAGNVRLMNELGAEVPAGLAEQFAAEGKTPLFFAKNGELVGTIAVADEVKETSAAAIAALRKLGVDVRMLTGDNRVTAEAIARRVGLTSEQVIADVLPADKERHVRELQDAGGKVAMVGDGINDSPALARADVGLAIGTGADIAKEGADVVLMRSDLMDVARAIELSRATIRNIKQDLFWALFYNGIGIPLAAGVFFPLTGWQLSPMFGAAAMSLSSVCVVSNALRLKSFKPKVAK